MSNELGLRGRFLPGAVVISMLCLMLCLAVDPVVTWGLEGGSSETTRKTAVRESEAVLASTEDLADHIVISEIYYNPKDDYDSEYIEFYNPTGSAVDLSSWSFSDDGGSNWVNFSEDTDEQNTLTIQAYGFLLLVDGGWSTGKDDSGWPGGDVVDELSLTNGGATVEIRDPGGSLIDSVTYEGDADDKQVVERKAGASSTKSSMRGSGSDADRGNGYDTDSFNDDFVGPLPPEPQNTSSTIEPYESFDNQAPVADPGGPYACDVDETIQLDGSGSSDPDGTVESYEWDFDGNGQYDDATGVSPSFSCDSSGTVEINLKVTDDAGAVDTATTPVSVGSEGGGESSGKLVTREIEITQAGWNMVSIPVKPKEGSPAATFKGVSPSKIIRWDPEKDGGYGGYKSSDEGFSLKTCRGNWIYLEKSAVPKTFRITGEFKDNREIVLTDEGWHQFGVPAETTIESMGVRKEKEGKVISFARAADEGLLSRFLWEWDPEREIYYAYEFGVNEKSVEAGKGYWIRTDRRNLRLVIPYTTPPSPPSGVNPKSMSGIPLTGAEAEERKIPTPPPPPVLQTFTGLSVVASPNPVTNEERVEFRVRKPEVEALRVKAYNLAGKEVFSSDFRSGNSLKWNLTAQGGARLANGIYLYQIEARDSNNRTMIKVGKLLVLR